MKTGYLGGGINLVTSVFGRIGVVTAALGDYATSLITNDSSVSGATVKDALNALIGVSAGLWVYYDVRGTGAASASLVQKFIPRTNSTMNTGATTSEYPISTAGTFTFKTTWRVPGTPLTTGSVRIELFKNGVATGIFDTIAPGATTGQFSGSLTVAVGDGIAMGILQSNTEAQANWLLCTSTNAVP